MDSQDVTLQMSGSDPEFISADDSEDDVHKKQEIMDVSANNRFFLFLSIQGYQ